MIIKPKFPNVPNLAGVPPLPRNINAIIAPGRPFAVIQDVFAFAFSVDLVWGIFNSAGDLAIKPDTVIALEFSNEFKISSFPVQDGQFANYNKVAVPYEVAVRVSKGGTIAERNAFLLQVENLIKALDMFDVVTPEKTYTNANLTRYAYVRGREEGASVLTLDLYFEEVRQVNVQYSTTATQNAKEPQARPVTTTGRVLPKEVTPATKSGLQQVVDFIKGKIR